MSKTEIIEFGVLIIWSILYCVAMIKGWNIPTSVSMAYSTYTAAIAAKAFSN